MEAYLITDFGAKANGELQTKAIQKAIDTAAAVGGGKVVIPSGEFFTGSLELKDNIELHLTPGSILKFSDKQADYPVVMSRWEGVKRKVYASCLFAYQAKNIAVTGFGLLDGNGKNWWHLQREDLGALHYPRPKMVSFDSCEKITLRDFSVKNSPSWTIHPVLCQDVTIDNLRIKNPADSPNTDGIDPESCLNVRITNCNIDVGDDCIAIKAGTEDTTEKVACENITITNCTMVHGHGGVVLGSEMSGDIRNVAISNCIFQDTDRGIRFKSRRGRGGIVEDIRIDNLIMERVMCPFILNLYYFCGPKGDQPYVWDKKPYPITEETPHFRRIHFANITARKVRAAAGFIYGLGEKYVSEVTFQNISVEMTEKGEADYPAMMAGLKKMKQQGFYLGFAKDIKFNEVQVIHHVGPAFYLESCENIELYRCESKTSTGESFLLEEQA